MNDFRSTGGPAEGGGSDVGRTALWVIRELGLPAIVKACVSCRSARHHPTGKFRVNANGKLLDVWMLICCELCGRTSKIPVHERIHVQALDSERLLMFEHNDPAMVRDLAMDGALAGHAAYHLDWSGTWKLETDMPSGELEREDPAPLKVIIRFELPAPIRVEKLLAAGFGLSRSAVRGMVDSGRIRLPMAIDAKAREDFTLFVITTHCRHATRQQVGRVAGAAADVYDANVSSISPTVEIDHSSPVPLHEQVAAAVRRAIADGEAGPGERLPPARDLAAVLGVNANTVFRALRTLREEGLVEFRRGRGVSVTGIGPQRSVVVAKARELVAVARRYGYRPEELTAIIEQVSVELP